MSIDGVIYGGCLFFTLFFMFFVGQVSFVEPYEIIKATELCQLRGAELNRIDTWMVNEYQCTDSYTWHVLPKPKVE